MQLMGETVNHARFGKGTIVSVEDRRMTVQFAQPFGEKRFVYPDAFETYLMVENEGVALSIEQAMAERKAQLEAKANELRERLEAHSRQAAEDKAQERALKARARKNAAKTADKKQ